MRKEPFIIGDYVHVYNRGNRKMPIFYDESDRWRFLRILRYFNDEYSPMNIFRELELLIKEKKCTYFEWPQDWPVHKPLVKILAYHLAPNHFHLLLKETVQSGISRFMKRLGDGFTHYMNAKHGETGKLFQGSYKSRTIKDEKHLQYLDAYIQTLNPFELYPGGIEQSLKEFDKAFEFAINFPFSSIGESFGERRLFILDRDILKEIFPQLETYKTFAYDTLLGKNIKESLGKSSID